MLSICEIRSQTWSFPLILEWQIRAQSFEIMGSSYQAHIEMPNHSLEAFALKACKHGGSKLNSYAVRSSNAFKVIGQ